MDHDSLLERAIELAHEGVRRGAGGPFGALLAREGEIVSEGWNCVTSIADPTAHAEIVAIRKACKERSTHDLSGHVLYSSSEPCPMCLAAGFWARVDRIYFASTREDAARIGFDDHFFYEELERAPEARRVPCIHMPRPSALAPMEAWAGDAERTPY